MEKGKMISAASAAVCGIIAGKVLSVLLDEDRRKERAAKRLMKRLNRAVRDARKAGILVSMESFTAADSPD